MEQSMIEVNKLETSPQNARRTATKAAMEEMKASIRAHGLMQNLVVTDDGNGVYRSGHARFRSGVFSEYEHRQQVVALEWRRRKRRRLVRRIHPHRDRQL